MRVDERLKRKKAGGRTRDEVWLKFTFSVNRAPAGKHGSQVQIRGTGRLAI